MSSQIQIYSLGHNHVSKPRFGGAIFYAKIYKEKRSLVLNNVNVPRPHFGDVFFADLLGDDHVQAGRRPVVIAQNDIGNRFSTTVEVIPMSSRVNKAKYMPTHVLVHPNAINGLKTASIVLAEQVVTIPKKRLLAFLGALDKETLGLIGQARRTQSPFHSL